MDERFAPHPRRPTPAEKETIEQLTDIIVAVTDFARRQPDLLRLCFSIAFAAPGEIPSGFKKHHKMLESYHFVREIIGAGLKRGVLNSSFSVDELTQAYFHLIQHSTVLTVFEIPAGRRSKAPGFACRREWRRGGWWNFSSAARRIPESALAQWHVIRARMTTKPAKITAIVAGLGLSLLSANGQPTAPTPTIQPSTNFPSATSTSEMATNTATEDISPLAAHPHIVPGHQCGGHDNTCRSWSRFLPSRNSATTNAPLRFQSRRCPSSEPLAVTRQVIPNWPTVSAHRG